GRHAAEKDGKGESLGTESGDLHQRHGHKKSEGYAGFIAATPQEFDKFDHENQREKHAERHHYNEEKLATEIARKSPGEVHAAGPPSCALSARLVSIRRAVCQARLKRTPLMTAMH